MASGVQIGRAHKVKNRTWTIKGDNWIQLSDGRIFYDVSIKEDGENSTYSIGLYDAISWKLIESNTYVGKSLNSMESEQKHALDIIVRLYNDRIDCEKRKVYGCLQEQQNTG
jgi:hypothetical protein